METHVSITKTRRVKPEHLMCGQPVWGITGVLACSYLAYLSYDHVRRNQFAWPHDAWTIVTYLVWILLMTGLLLEPRCWRERLFFGLVLTNFALGFTLAAWASVSMPVVRQVRVVSAVLWATASVVSLSVTFLPGVRKI